MRLESVMIRVALAVGILCNSMAVLAEVAMKGRDGRNQMLNRKSTAKSQMASRWHLILDFSEAPTAETVRALTARGLRVVAYLPSTGVIVGTEGEPDLTGLSLRGYDALQPEDKISPELMRATDVSASADNGRGASGQNRRAFYMVEFHGDVPWEDRRELVLESGFEIRDHRDLVGEHMLVLGSPEQVRALAEWDEVAYIFPASGELVTGLPLVGCVGGATEAGLVGQMTQRVGEGWDGVGLNRAALTYTLQSLSSRLPAAELQSEIERAMAAWSRVVQVQFQRTTGAAGSKNVNIVFGARDHGDPYPFDGAGRTLAHTFYPSPPNPEPIAGDLHFDNDEPWNIGADIDVFSVALHELGHALGLGHSDVPNAVMYPYYRRATSLTPEDIGAARLLYATTAEGPAAPAPLVLTISAPAPNSSTTATAATVSGTLTGPVGAPALRWQTTKGASGTGTTTSDGRGGYTWQAAAIPLSVGETSITVSASDTMARSVDRTVTVTRLAPPVTVNPVPPVAPPSTPPSTLRIDVLSPGLYSILTRSQTNASGTVAGATGQVTVRWASGQGRSGVAIVTPVSGGVFRWEVGPIPLQLGVNIVIVTVTDAANRSVSKSMQIIYRFPTEDEPDDNGPPVPPPPPSPTPTPTPVPALRLAVVTPGANAVATRNPGSAGGTVAGGVGRPSVRWSSDRGFAGTAVVSPAADGTFRWDVNPLALQPGANGITVVATDSMGATTSQIFRVTLTMPREDDPDADVFPPRLSIVSPATSFLMTSVYSLSVRGTAFDPSGVSEVRWECTCGSQGVAQGTTQWTIPNISLPPGTFVIKVTARDLAGNEGVTSFVVFRYEN